MCTCALHHFAFVVRSKDEMVPTLMCSWHQCASVVGPTVGEGAQVSAGGKATYNMRSWYVHMAFVCILLFATIRDCCA